MAAISKNPVTVRPSRVPARGRKPPSTHNQQQERCIWLIYWGSSTHGCRNGSYESVNCSRTQDQNPERSRCGILRRHSRGRACSAASLTAPALDHWSPRRHSVGERLRIRLSPLSAPSARQLLWEAASATSCLHRHPQRGRAREPGRVVGLGSGDVRRQRDTSYRRRLVFTIGSCRCHASRFFHLLRGGGRSSLAHPHARTAAKIPRLCPHPPL